MALKVFYRPEQSVDATDLFSPSARKPAEAVTSWKQLDPHTEIIRFAPLDRADLALAHDRAYVDAVLDGREANGFGNRRPEIAASLPYTTGSLYAAAWHAWSTKECAVSPTSGFHHAGYDFGGGFCTFNGLVVAAQKLQHNGCKKVGILDLDRHYGNGTDNILRHLSLSYIVHYTFGGFAIERSDARAWLDELGSVLGEFAGCDVVLYQAGADPHVNDPLGGILTTEQLFERDSIVFTEMRRMGVPVAWNLAGGYQTPLRKVLDIHDNTARASLATYAQPC